MIALILFLIISPLAFVFFARGIASVGIFAHTTISQLWLPVASWLYFWRITIPINIALCGIYYFFIGHNAESFFIFLFVQCLPAIYAIPPYKKACKNQ